MSTAIGVPLAPMTEAAAQVPEEQQRLGPASGTQVDERTLQVGQRECRHGVTDPQRGRAVAGRDSGRRVLATRQRQDLRRADGESGSNGACLIDEHG